MTTTELRNHLIELEAERAVAIASSARRFTPPSENESGVTLTIPMTDGRGKRSSMGGGCTPRAYGRRATGGG